MVHPIDALLAELTRRTGGAAACFVGIVEVEGALRTGEVRGGPAPCAPGATICALGEAWTHRARWGTDRPAPLGPGLPHALRIAGRATLGGVLLSGPDPAGHLAAARTRLAALAGAPRPRSHAVWVVDPVRGPVHGPVDDDGWLAAALPELREALRLPGPHEIHAGGAHVRILPLAGTEGHRAVIRVPARAVSLSPLLALTPTQLLVASYVAVGARNAEIARTLDRSEETVRTHVAAVYDRLGIGSRAELSRLWARDAAWLDPARPDPHTPRRP